MNFKKRTSLLKKMKSYLFYGRDEFDESRSKQHFFFNLIYFFDIVACQYCYIRSFIQKTLKLKNIREMTTKAVQKLIILKKIKLK